MFIINRIQHAAKKLYIHTLYIHLPLMYSYMAILKKIGVGCALFSNITVHYSEYELFQKFKEAQIWTTD